MKTATLDPATEAKRQPVYWFLILEDAANNGDHITAAEAQRELARMGIRVNYGRATDATEEATPTTEAKAVRT